LKSKGRAIGEKATPGGKEISPSRGNQLNKKILFCCGWTNQNQNARATHNQTGEQVNANMNAVHKSWVGGREGLRRKKREYFMVLNPEKKERTARRE